MSASFAVETVEYAAAVVLGALTTASLCSARGLGMCIPGSHGLRLQTIGSYCNNYTAELGGRGVWSLSAWARPSREPVREGLGRLAQAAGAIRLELLLAPPGIEGRSRCGGGGSLMFSAR